MVSSFPPLGLASIARSYQPLRPVFHLFSLATMPAVANTLFMAQSLVLIGSGLYMLLSPDEAVRSPQLAGTPPEVLLSFG